MGVYVRWIAAFATVLSVAAQPGFAQNGGNAQRGASLAGSQCAECHAVNKGERSPKATVPTFSAIAATPGMTSLALEAALQTSHRQMPNVLLERADRADIIAYILSLKDQQ
ncbi:MAG: c-type cytochrome [Xanthobacteraceae bacterium]